MDEYLWNLALIVVQVHRSLWWYTCKGPLLAKEGEISQLYGRPRSIFIGAAFTYKEL